MLNPKRIGSVVKKLKMFNYEHIMDDNQLHIGQASLKIFLLYLQNERISLVDD
jgi:hypothetical protein